MYPGPAALLACFFGASSLASSGPQAVRTPGFDHQATGRPQWPPISLSIVHSSRTHTRNFAASGDLSA